MLAKPHLPALSDLPGNEYVRESNVRGLGDMPRLRDLPRRCHMPAASDVPQRPSLRATDTTVPTYLPRFAYMPGISHLLCSKLRRERDMSRIDLYCGNHLHPVCCNLRASPHMSGEPLVQWHAVLRDSKHLHRFAHMQGIEDLCRDSNL